MEKATQCIHSGTLIDPNTGGVNTPIFTSSAYKYIDSGAHTYPRYFNTPNQTVVVEKLCALEGAEDGMLFSSGMAAISTTVLGLCQKGGHILVQEGVYGGTYDFITGQLNAFGIDYTFVPPRVENFAKEITGNTKLIYVETPSNPLLTITDLAKIAELGRQRKIATAIDNTFASPINQNPIRLGIDIVLHSGTKYLGGHSDLCCGAALSSKALMQRIRTSAYRLGGSLNGSDCALLERSLKTLVIRVERQTENAGRIASYLESHPEIARAHYPGLTGHAGHNIAKVQMHGFGAMVSFELGKNTHHAADFMRRLKLITPALSLGGIESTICSPALTSHAKMPTEERRRIGIGDGLLRLSVGVEDASDLIADIEQALDK